MQHDYDIANASGAVVRSDLNDVLEAIATGNSGATAPTVTFPFMRWFDTSTNTLKIRNAANTAWLTAWVDTTAANMGMAALSTAQLFTALQKFTKGADLASASTLVVGTDGNFFDVTGTTTITGMTVAAGALFVLQFDGALTLTDGASLELGSESIAAAAGDHALFYATAANTVTLLAYRSATSSPKPPSQAEAEAGTATTPRPWTAERVAQAISARTARIAIEDQKASGTAGDTPTTSAWTKATLNTEVVDSGGHASLASSVITLAAGTYYCRAVKVLAAQASVGSQFKLRLRNTSDGATLLNGFSNRRPSMAADVGGFEVALEGFFTIAATKNLELQYWTTSANAPNAITTGEVEVYAGVYLVKMA